MKKIAFFTILALLIFSSTCKSPESPDDGDLQTDYSGSWSGTTSQGKSISFTIVDNAITHFSFEFEWRSGTGCSVSGNVSSDYGTPIPINGDTFTISGNITNLSYTFNGTFSSVATANGTSDLTASGTCPSTANPTWSANKN
jgi:hypothetical protein